MKLVFIFWVLFGAAANASDGRNLVNEYYGCPNSSYLCEALNQNMDRDTSGCRLSPKHTKDLGAYMDQQNSNEKVEVVKGRIRYFGPVSGNYGYTVIRKNKHNFKVLAKVYFKNLSQYSSSEVQTYKRRFKSAAAIWNANSPFGKRFEFDFQIASQRKESVIAPELIRGNTRGPYFDRWSFKWSTSTIAHEFGHVLGLFDEYSYTDNNNPNCSSRSLMCSSFRGAPQHYHYHLVLQRVFCEV